MTGSARMFVSAWWLFCVIIAAIYSGNLTASFAVTLYDPSFTTLQEMLQEGTYDFGTVPGTIWFDIFKVFLLSKGYGLTSLRYSCYLKVMVRCL